MVVMIDNCWSFMNEYNKCCAENKLEDSIENIKLFLIYNGFEYFVSIGLLDTSFDNEIALFRWMRQNIKNKYTNFLDFPHEVYVFNDLTDAVNFKLIYGGNEWKSNERV